MFWSQLLEETFAHSCLSLSLLSSLESLRFTGWAADLIYLMHFTQKTYLCIWLWRTAVCSLCRLETNHIKYKKNKITKTDLYFLEFGDLKLKEWGVTVLQVSALLELINTTPLIKPSLDYFHTLVSTTVFPLPSCQFLLRHTSQAHLFP